MNDKFAWIVQTAAKPQREQVKTIITVGPEMGYLFEGKPPGSFAYVPEACVTFTPDGKPAVDELKHTQSAWDVKNIRFNAGETSGNRLYLDPRGLETGRMAPAAVRFIERRQRAHRGKNG